MIISNILGTSKNVYYSSFLKKNKGNSKPLFSDVAWNFFVFIF